MNYSRFYCYFNTDFIFLQLVEKFKKDYIEWKKIQPPALVFLTEKVLEKQVSINLFINFLVEL